MAIDWNWQRWQRCLAFHIEIGDDDDYFAIFFLFWRLSFASVEKSPARKKWPHPPPSSVLLLLLLLLLLLPDETEWEIAPPHNSTKLNPKNCSILGLVSTLDDWMPPISQKRRSNMNST